jgi:hypothetical protein
MAVDACYHDGTLYLDNIAKHDNQEGPDANRFIYYVYKVNDGLNIHLSPSCGSRPGVT